MNSDILGTRNDLFNVHVLFACNIVIFALASMFDVIIYVVKKAVSGCYLGFLLGGSFYPLPLSHIQNRVKRSLINVPNFLVPNSLHLTITLLLRFLITVLKLCYSGESSPSLCLSIKKKLFLYFFISPLSLIKM